LFRIRLLAFFLAASVVAVVPVSAAQETQLRAVRGTVGYQLTKDAPFTRVEGSLLLTDDRIAVTRAASNALLVLADSSAVALGANTNIEVSAITQAAAAAPTAMSLVAGTIRFDIRHPAGGRANYRFETPTSQIAVRGTIGILSSGPDGDTITCLDCAPDDVTITTNRRKAGIVLLTGQTAVVSAAGDITVATTATAFAATAAAVGLSVIADAPSPFAPGIDRSRPPVNDTAPIVAGVIAGGIIAGVASENTTPAPVPTIAIPISTPSPTPTPTHSPVPTPAPSPTGALTINAHAQLHPQSAPAPAAPAAPNLPAAGRPGVPGGRP
jgi:hypothetical protein